MPWNRILQTIATAAQSLAQQKLRAALSVLGVVCGIMAVVAMVAVGQGAKREALKQIERLGTRNIYVRALDLTPAQRASASERRSPGLNPGDLVRIQRGCPTVARIAALRDLRVALVGTPKEVTPEVVACSAGYAELLNLPVASGRFIAVEDGLRKNLVCVLGHDVADGLARAGDAIDVVRMGNQLFKVVGILRRSMPANDRSSAVIQRNANEMVFIPLESAGSVTGLEPSFSAASAAGASELTEIVVQVARGADVVATARMVARILEVAHHGVRDYQLIVPLELLAQARKTRRTADLVLGAIAGISLLVGGIGIMNIMLATVSERVREIGIRRSVGATRRDIMAHFLSEAVLLTVAGGFIGLLTGLAAVWGIARLAGWPVAVSWWGLLLPLGVSLLVGVFFGLYPARKAARMDPVAALRHE